jgi:hypothetical protein
MKLTDLPLATIPYSNASATDGSASAPTTPRERLNADDWMATGSSDRQAAARAKLAQQLDLPLAWVSRSEGPRPTLLPPSPRTKQAQDRAQESYVGLFSEIEAIAASLEKAANEKAPLSGSRTGGPSHAPAWGASTTRRD